MPHGLLDTGLLTEKFAMGNPRRDHVTMVEGNGYIAMVTDRVTRGVETVRGSIGITIKDDAVVDKGKHCV